MTDNLPTIWEAVAHTVAKHRILEAYLDAWLPIMSRQSHTTRTSSLLFVDAFAGPGSYSGGEDGSPIRALKCVASHKSDFPVPVTFLFIEQNKERFNHLKRAIAQECQSLLSSPRIKDVILEHGDCVPILSSYFDEMPAPHKQMGPAFFFLDQFGYSDIPMTFIQRIMSQPMCEVFLYLNWDHMHRFLTDPTKSSSRTNAFGGDQWRGALSLEHRQRPQFILSAYRDALKEKAASRYVWHFAMCDSDDKLTYWLFFCTNSLRGLEEMKRAMCKVDPTGGFRFSDKNDPSQLALFASYTEEMLAEDLAAALKGKRRSVRAVKEFALTETPAYKYKASLKLLEKAGRLIPCNPPDNRRTGTFPSESMELQFL